MNYKAPPPPYSHSAPASSQRKGPANISTLPLSLLHKILSLTLDPIATPSRFRGDIQEEKIRRIWGLFRGLRGVDRRFYRVATSLLREIYHPRWLHYLQGYSTDAFPHNTTTRSHGYYGNEKANRKGHEAEEEQRNVFQDRTRETAVFDRWIAVVIGEELRRVESEWSEEGDGSDMLIRRLQPSARLEDLLLTLPSSLINPSQSPPRSNSTTLPLPLPHSNLSINLTPTWLQLYLHSKPLAPTGAPGVGNSSKSLVIEVRRIESSRGGISERDVLRMIQRVGEGLEDLGRGLVPWGGRVG